MRLSTLSIPKIATGLGFRRDLSSILNETKRDEVDFIELAPENWVGVGGKWGRTLKRAAKLYPITCHGLSLSLGSPEPLDIDFLSEVKGFLKDFNVSIFSEHLSFAKFQNAHLYDLLPIPFREDAINHVVDRIKQVQDFLGIQIAIENVSYYTPMAPEMTEVEFISSVLEKADCKLLLDVNNVFVNGFNHKYDPISFIDSIPLERVAYIHMAGHEQRSEDLIVDTHGAEIVSPVYELFEYAFSRIKPVPVLLERDNNFPDFSVLSDELNRLREIQNRATDE